jgi:hypothetical protein
VSSTSPGSDRKQRLALTREESGRSDQVRSGIVTTEPQQNSDAKMPAHHDGNRPHQRADALTASHHHHHHQQGSGHPVATDRTTSAHGHQHDVHAGHDKHAGQSVEMFRRKFRGTLLLSVPTLVWAPMIQQWFGYEAPGGPVASRWIPAIFGSLVFPNAFLRW